MKHPRAPIHRPESHSPRRVAACLWIVSSLCIGTSLVACGEDRLNTIPKKDPVVPNNCPTEVVLEDQINAGAATTYKFRDYFQGATGNGRFAVHGPSGEEVSGTVPTLTSPGAASTTRTPTAPGTPA